MSPPGFSKPPTSSPCQQCREMGMVARLGQGGVDIDAEFGVLLAGEGESSGGDRVELAMRCGLRCPAVGRGSRRNGAGEPGAGTSQRRLHDRGGNDALGPSEGGPIGNFGDRNAPKWG